MNNLPPAQAELLRSIARTGRIGEMSMPVPSRRVASRLVLAGLLRRVQCRGLTTWEITDEGREAILAPSEADYELARKFVLDLFTDGQGAVADRLVLTNDDPHRDLGGLSARVTVERIAAILAKREATA